MIVRALVLLVLVVGSWPAEARQTTPAPGQPSVSRALVDEFLAASTEDARERKLAELPAMATAEFRTALLTRGREENAAGDRNAAIRSYEGAVWLGHRSSPRVEAAALIGLSAVLGPIGDYTRATRVLLQALALAESANEREMIASAANNLGIVYRRLGEFDLALVQFERAFSLHEEDGRVEAAARTLNNIGLVYQQQSNSRAALDYYERSLALKEKFAPAPEVITTLANIGEIYSIQNNGPLAIAYSNRALAMAERSGNLPLLSSALNNAGFAQLNFGRLDEAEAAFLRCLPLAEKSETQSLVAMVLSNLGIVALERKQWDLARERLERARQIQSGIGDRIGEGETLVQLGELDLGQGRPVDAAEKLAKAHELLASTGTPVSLSRVLYLEGQLQAQNGRTAAAIASFEAAIRLSERARDLVAGGTEDRLRFFESRVDPYYGLTEVYASSGRADEAFATMERARARGLLDVLAAGKPGVALLTPEEQARQRELDTTLLSLTTRIETERTRPGAGLSPVPDLEAELARVRRTRDEFSLGLDQSHPDLRFIRGEAPIVSPDNLVASLPPRTGLVEFSTGPTGSWVFLVTDGHGTPALSITRLRSTADQIDRLSTQFARAVATRDLAFATTARELYDALLGPIDARLAGLDHVIVVPSGALWEVPFQALRTPRKRYLVEERAVSYAPSASAFRQLAARHRPMPTAPRVVAFGDPGTELPNAAREAQAVAALYGDNRSLVSTAQDATEKRFRQIAPGADIIHIATHGVIDNTSPLYSHVVLAATRGAGSEGDGRLEGREILNLRLAADLVVLSACETARGHIANGEGVLGMSWAIFAAGASTAAVSLWQVDSASTTELMTAFHRGRQERRAERAPTAQAMRAAQLGLLARPEYRHPYYWAGFVVVGVP